MPAFIMKALHADDLEDALALGLMDCCRCGLCSFVCPSKIELTQNTFGRHGCILQGSIMKNPLKKFFDDTKPLFTGDGKYKSMNLSGTP